MDAYLPENDLWINAFLIDNFSAKETYIELENEAFEFRNYLSYMRDHGSTLEFDRGRVQVFLNIVGIFRGRPGPSVS